MPGFAGALFALSAEDVSAATGAAAGVATAALAVAGAAWAFRQRIGDWFVKHRGETQQLDQAEREELRREKEAEKESVRREGADDVKACWQHVRRIEAQYEAERKYLESTAREAYARRDAALTAEREAALKAARLEEQVRHLLESAEGLRREVVELRQSLSQKGTDEHRPLPPESP